MADESKYPTRIAPYGLRMPPDLKDRVQAAAEANNRSMNAEIVARLEATFTEHGIDMTAHGMSELIRRVAGIEARLDQLRHDDWQRVVTGENLDTGED